MENNITFIIPSLNRLTLPRTIRSLLGQTDPNWKCILIYDGVEGRVFDDERIRIIQTNKMGSNSAHHGMAGLVRNEGMKICDTEWIGFLDDDDTIHPDYVKTLFEKYSDKDFVVWRMKYIHGLILPNPSYNEITFGSVGISFSYKNKFENLLFDNNRDGEDFDFLLKLKSLTDNYLITPEVYYNVNH